MGGHGACNLAPSSEAVYAASSVPGDASDISLGYTCDSLKTKETVIFEIKGGKSFKTKSYKIFFTNELGSG